ncbi:MAG: hypothetical protein K5633_06925 [Paludibacteraceae bacterium]|jgi:hypothetical protein|nr:hypothetical protein [Paludibacteraceae bacterium]
MSKDQQTNFLIAYTVDRMTEYLIADFGYDIHHALQTIYRSNAYQKLSEPENGLYTQSPSYIYELLQQEL